MLAVTGERERAPTGDWGLLDSIPCAGVTSRRRWSQWWSRLDLGRSPSPAVGVGRRLGFRQGREIKQGRRRTRGWFCAGLLYGAVEVATPHCRRRRSCQREGEERHGVAVASVHGGDEDDPLPLFFSEGVSWAAVGDDLGQVLGCSWALVLGCRLGCGAGKVQVCFSLLSSFSVLFSVFNSGFYNSNLNLLILQVFDN